MAAHPVPSSEYSGNNLRTYAENHGVTGEKYDRLARALGMSSATLTSRLLSQRQTDKFAGRFRRECDRIAKGAD